MRVLYDWDDAAGDTYSVEAEVNPVDYNRVTIINVSTSDDVEVDFDDFDDSEKMQIRWGAKRAAQELDSSEDPLHDNEEDENNDESNYENY